MARVGIDPKKIEAIVSWPKPANIQALRGFLGLTGYYWKFVKNYEIISKPLTELLKKEGFKWKPKVEQAFEQPKRAMSNVPTLGLPDFSKPFTLETDTNNTGIGVVLSQEGGPWPFLVKP